MTSASCQFSIFEMASKLKDIITNDVRLLIKQLSDFEEHQDNFKACERFVLSNVLHHRYVSVDGRAVRRSMEGIVTKFHVHGLLDRAQELETLVHQFLSSQDIKDQNSVDIQWCSLSLLLHLGQNPTNILQNKETHSNSSSVVISDDDDDVHFDWVSYLREGDEEYMQDWCDDSDSEDETDHLVVTIPESKLSWSPQTKEDTLSVCLPSPEERGGLPSYFAAEHSNILNAQNIFAAESWLRDSLQHDWWLKPHFKHEPLSNAPFAQTGTIGDQKGGIKTSTLSEHKIVLEIIWLLSAPSCDSAVFMKVISENGLRSNFCVRPHVTAPSITQDVFTSFTSSVCVYADMVKELHESCSQLIDSSNRNQICSSYEAYRYALMLELKLFSEKLSLLEQRAHQQDETLTLLVLSHELSPWLSMLASLYELHLSAILDWRSTPNWLCATHLLSVLLSSLRNTEAIDCKFRIFVRTFQVYINIIDQWLTGGLLHDPRGEFFICRTENTNSSLGASFEKRDWEREMAARGVESPKALQVLGECLLKAAQPLHILCELKRLPELCKHMSNRCSSASVFLQNLVDDLEVSQIMSDNISETKDKTKPWWKQLDSDKISTSQSRNDVEVQKEVVSNTSIDVEGVMTHLYRLEDPLLLKDFQALFSETNASTSPLERSTPSLVSRLIFLSQSMSKYFPLESCVERAVLCLSHDWEGIAGSLVADILIQEHQLLFHLYNSQSVFMLQAYNKLQPFLSHLFKLILLRTDILLLDSHSLSVLLQDCMDSDQFAVFVNLENKDILELNALDFIDSLQFKYQVEWPLCVIFGNKCQSSYNQILRLLLKLRWGLWILEKLNVADFHFPADPSFSQRLLYLRFWLLHVIRGSYSFLSGHILNALWLKFQGDFKSIQDLHSMIQVHEKFLDSAMRKSLNATEPDAIKNALFQLVVLAENLHSLWFGGSSTVSSSKLRNIETCYAECHLFLAAALHSLAEADGLQHLVFLSDLFNWNIPHKNGSS